VLGAQAKPFGVSLAIHAALVGLLGLLAARQVMERREADFVEFEVIRRPAVQPSAPVERAPEPPRVDDPPIPTASRPERVPQETRMRKVERARPFQPESVRASSSREAPEDTEAVPAPTVPLPVFDFDSTTGGAGTGGYVSISGGEGTVPVRAGPGGGDGRGTAGGGRGPLANQDAIGVLVSPDWEITEMPEPLNDRDFEPEYPALARREGREAVVVVSLQVDVSGRVVDARVVEGPRGYGFGASALAYARKLRFRPARAGTRAVASRIDWSIHYYVRN